MKSRIGEMPVLDGFGIKRGSCNAQDRWSRSVCSRGVHSITGVRSRSLRLSLLSARPSLGLPGVVLFHKLPAVPGFGLWYGCVLWPEPSIFVRIATARGPPTLSGALIKPTGARKLIVRLFCRCNARWRRDEIPWWITSSCTSVSVPRNFRPQPKQTLFKAIGVFVTAVLCELHEQLRALEDGPRTGDTLRIRSSIAGSAAAPFEGDLHSVSDLAHTDRRRLLIGRIHAAITIISA